MLGAIGQDGGHRGERNQVVDDGGFAEQALVRRQRRLGAHLAALAFEAFEQRGFLAADIGPGADADLDVELRLGAQQALGFRQHDSAFHDADGVGILRADVDVALGSADGEARDRHALDQQEGIAFHDHAIGIGARVAFVGVADDVFAIRRRVGDGLPLDAGREARAAAAAQARLRDLLDGGHSAQAPGAFQAAIAAMGAIVGERQWIDDAAAREGDARLALQEGSILGPADAQRVGGTRWLAVGEKTRNVLRRHRPEGDAPARCLDLDHRLEPEQAARAGANHFDGNTEAPGLADDGGGDAIGANRAGGGIARNEDPRRHRPASRTRSCSDARFSRATGSPSSRAVGAHAQRPKQ